MVLYCCVVEGKTDISDRSSIADILGLLQKVFFFFFLQVSQSTRWTTLAEKAFRYQFAD